MDFPDLWQEESSKYGNNRQQWLLSHGHIYILESLSRKERITTAWNVLDALNTVNKEVQVSKLPTFFVQTLKVLKVVHNCPRVADALQHQHTCLAWRDHGGVCLVAKPYIHMYMHSL